MTDLCKASLLLDEAEIVFSPQLYTSSGQRAPFIFEKNARHSVYDAEQVTPCGSCAAGQSIELGTGKTVITHCHSGPMSISYAYSNWSKLDPYSYTIDYIPRVQL